MSFKVGDEIIMNSYANGNYGITRSGSIGIIKKIDKTRAHGQYNVKFSKIKNGNSYDEQYCVGKSYWVDDSYFELNRERLPYELVINKIKQMDERFAMQQKVKKQFKGDYSYAA